jgi:asparagine synthase (glutamine-hydrolysing)
VGGCLSGGLDSGSIIASVSRLLGRDAAQFRALTLSNEGFEGDEGAMASLTAKTTGVRWVPVVPDLQSMEQDLEAMIRAMGEPFSTLSMLGQYKLMQQARREGLKVMLDGQGGDEIFLGYPTVAQRVIGDYLRRGHFADALSEWFGLQRNAGLPLVRSLLGNAFFSSPRLGLLRNTERVRGVVERDLIAETRREVVEDLFRADDTTSLQIRELTRYVLPQLLRYEDRNSMAFGLEARVPLLAVDLVNLALRLPLDWKVRKGWTKFALREAMRGRLPDGVLWNRRKRGFEVPQGRWLQTMLPTIRGWLEDLPRDAPVNGAEIAARLSWGEDAPRMSRCLSVALWIRFSGVQA